MTGKGAGGQYCTGEEAVRQFFHSYGWFRLGKIERVLGLGRDF